MDSRLSPRRSVTGDARLVLRHVRHAAPGTLRPQVRERHDRQPRFHGPGAGRLSPQAPLAAFSRLSPVTRPRERSPHSRNADASARELRPNPIRSGTSCHDPAAPLDGDPAALPRGHPATQPVRAAREAPVTRFPRTWGQGPHCPLSREEDRTPPHPRCLPSMSRPAPGCVESSAEASPPSYPWAG